MAESRLIPARPASPPRRPGARSPLRPAGPVPLPRRPLQETDSLEPPLRVREAAPALEGPAEKPLPPAPPQALQDAPLAPVDRSDPKPPRSQAEKALFVVLLLSSVLNLAAFLIFGGLTRTDLLFAAVIFVSGVALLVLAEINRRSGRSRSTGRGAP